MSFQVSLVCTPHAQALQLEIYVGDYVIEVQYNDIIGVMRLGHFMETEHLIEQIRHLCSDEEGFAVKARGSHDYDWEKFREMIALLEQYVEAVKSDPCVNRTIFECVYATEAVLMGNLDHTDDSHPEVPNIRAALADINSVLIDLIAPASSTV